MDRARGGILRPARPSKRRRVAPELVRDRKTREVLAEDDDEAEVRIVECIEALVDRTAERLEQPDVLQAPKAGRRQPLQLGENALAGGPGHECNRLEQERLRALVHPKPELVLEAHRPEEAEGVVAEDRLGHGSDDAGPEVGAAVVRVVRLARSDMHGDRVEREVAGREVGVDPVADRCEVDGLVDAVGDHPPCSVALRQGEDRAAEAAGEAVRSLARVGTGDVEVENRSEEELVADCAPDDPRLLLRQDLAEALIHRS